MAIQFNIEGPETRRARELQQQEQQLRIAALKQQIAQSQPGYAVQAAGELGRELEESERNLQLQEELIGDVGRRRQDVAAAGRQLPEEMAGPVAPQSFIGPEMNRLLTAESQLILDARAMSARREALRKQLEGLTGTVPTPGGGTAPAGEPSTVRRRFEESVRLIQDYKNRRNAAQSQDELEAIDQAFATYEPIAKAQLRKDLENSRAIPGLDGLGRDDQAARDMRLRTSDFVSAVQSVDKLLDIDPAELSSDPDERLRQVARADALRAGLVGNLRLALAGPGQLSDYERRILESTIANPASLNPYTSRYAKSTLKELKESLGRKFAADASVYGYTLKSFQNVLDANAGPADIKSFSSTGKQDMTDMERQLRAAGMKDGDEVTIGGKRYRLGQ